MSTFAGKAFWRSRADAPSSGIWTSRLLMAAILTAVAAAWIVLLILMMPKH